MLDVGIIGLGGWGRRLVESVQGKSGKLRFAAAASGSSGKGKPFADQHGIKLYPDVTALLADPSITAVVSAGPGGLHAPHALQALQAGRHVLAVKPMATTKAEADALAAAAAKSGKLLAMGFNRCFYPNVALLRQRVKAGDLGTLVHAEGNFCVDRYRKVQPGSWKADPEQAPPGSLADHPLYLMIELLGPIAEVHAAATTQIATQIALADVTAVLLKFKNGQTGTLQANGVTPELSRLHVFGSEGWAEMRDQTYLVYHGQKGEPQVADIAEVDAERAEMEAFADAVTGAAAFPYSVADAVHAVAVLEAMAKSAKSGKPVLVA
ncbi:MAG TPA: Gfo/Idh/MocA family oxidoreductase [Alphaproteobacteria bacterium]|jgi:predicted dehydrogenase